MAASAGFQSKPKPGENCPHGTNRGYNAFGCRCKWCLMAHRAYHGAYAATQRGVQLRTTGPAELSERITVELTLDELVDWDAGAILAGLSRQAYIRRAVKEVR